MAKGKKVIVDITPKESQSNNKELVAYIEQKPYVQKMKSEVLELLSPVFNNIGEWKQKVDSIEVESIEDKQSMLIAKESRLFIMKTRTGLQKQVKEKIESIKEEMSPYLDQIEGWKDIFSFAESMMKSIESVAAEKEKHAQLLLKKVVDDLRELRVKQAEYVRNYLPPMVDIALLSEDEFKRILENAALAKEADDLRKQKEIEAEEKMKKENEILKKREKRLEKIYGLKLQKEYIDGQIFYCLEDIKIADDLVSTLDDDAFELIVSAAQKKLFDIEVENMKALEAEKKKEAEEKLKAEEEIKKRRELITYRISRLEGTKVEKDGLYWNNRFISSYDDLHDMDDNAFAEYVRKHNIKVEAFKIEFEEIKAAEELERQKRYEAARKAQEEADLKVKEQQEKLDAEKEAEQKSKRSDVEKMKEYADKLNELKLDLQEERFESDAIKKLKVNVTGLIKKIVTYIDDNC